LAMAVCGQSVELAGAAIGAVAVDELTSFDGPLGVRHGRLLTGMLGEAEYLRCPCLTECYQASASFESLSSESDVHRTQPFTLPLSP
jgi:hypothetical protein